MKQNVFCFIIGYLDTQLLFYFRNSYKIFETKFWFFCFLSQVTRKQKTPRKSESEGDNCDMKKEKEMNTSTAVEPEIQSKPAIARELYTSANNDSVSSTVSHTEKTSSQKKTPPSQKPQDSKPQSGGKRKSRMAANFGNFGGGSWEFILIYLCNQINILNS